MTEISVRELRNNVSEVLRRVEAGETLTVTVQGRPVADLIPRPRRPRTMSWDEFMRAPKADRALLDELRELLPDTTDDMPWP